MGAAPQRHHHLDALRLSAILLLIPYHAARYIQKGRFDSPILDAVVWFVHTWHMPLFFAISGFVAAGALARSGAWAQGRAKLKRLGIPLAVGMLTVVPLANLLVIASASLRPRAQGKPDARELELANVFSLTPRHLWFLAYLLAISMAVLAVHAILRRRPRLRAAAGSRLRGIAGSPLAIPVLALVAALILATKPGWAAGGTASSHLYPTPTLFAYYGLFFVFGWLVAGRAEIVERMRRGAWLRLGLGVALAVPAFLLFYDHADFTGNIGTPGILAADDQFRLLGLAAVGLVCWLTLFGVWGVAARHVRTGSPALSYMADASFWIYLVHIPFLVALQSSLGETSLHPGLRFAIAALGAFALSLASYAVFVRRTPVGRFLHGRRPRRGRDAPGRPPRPGEAGVALS